MEKKKVLVFGLSGVIGGIENFYIEYYRKLDKKKYQVDFVTKDESIVYSKEMLSNNSKIYYISKFKKHPIKHYLEIKKILKYNNYDIVHANLAYASNLLSIKLAKKYKVKKIIAHSHNTGMNHKGLTKLFHYINKHFIKKYATDLLACSKDAGEWMFGKKTNFTVLNNAINIDKFKYNKKYRKEIRDVLNIDSDCYVIGSIGRFCHQKNQSFTINLFSEFLRDNPNSRLILIGSGEDEQKILKLIHDLNIEDKVNIIHTNESYKYYSAFDIFVVPSFFEGLAVVTIEAQANGLPCILSSGLPRANNINSNVKYISLNDRDIWLKSLNSTNRVLKINKRIDSFDIDKQAHKLDLIYRGEYNEED